jgi:hypothetical protein
MLQLGVESGPFQSQEDLHEFQIYCYAEHVGVVVVGESVLEQQAGQPEALLLLELHHQQEVDHEVQSLTVPYVGVAFG